MRMANASHRKAQKRWRVRWLGGMIVREKIYLHRRSVESSAFPFVLPGRVGVLAVVLGAYLVSVSGLHVLGIGST